MQLKVYCITHSNFQEISAHKFLQSLSSLMCVHRGSEKDDRQTVIFMLSNV